MVEYSEGDQVEVYIPTPDDPDHRYHGKTGEIVGVLEDDLADVTSNPSRGHLYTVAFDDPELDTIDFRYDDIHPPNER